MIPASTITIHPLLAILRTHVVWLGTGALHWWWPHQAPTKELRNMEHPAVQCQQPGCTNQCESVLLRWNSTLRNTVLTARLGFYCPAHMPAHKHEVHESPRTKDYVVLHMERYFTMEPGHIYPPFPGTCTFCGMQNVTVCKPREAEIICFDLCSHPLPWSDFNA